MIPFLSVKRNVRITAEKETGEFPQILKIFFYNRIVLTYFSRKGQYVVPFFLF